MRAHGVLNGVLHFIGVRNGGLVNASDLYRGFYKGFYIMIVYGQYYIDETDGTLMNDGPGISIGYFETIDYVSTVENALSLGDIDRDGLDEKVYISGGNLIVDPLQFSLFPI